MNIIPVIDYLNGNVVLAKKGDRNEYMPVTSVLSSKSDINSIMSGILSLAEFKTIYIADLDGIENQQANLSLWSNISTQFPDIDFWIDLGSSINLWEPLINSNSKGYTFFIGPSLTLLFYLHRIKIMRQCV